MLESHPALRAYVSCCTHCGIEFLTDPPTRDEATCVVPLVAEGTTVGSVLANVAPPTIARHPAAGRKNTQRSAWLAPVEHDLPAELVEPPSLPSPPTPPSAAAPPQRIDEAEYELRLEDVVLRASTLSTSPMLSYLRMLVRLLEGVAVSPRQLVERLRRALRQRSIAFRSRCDYVLAFLHQHPP